MNTKITERGFQLVVFKDYYGAECSAQQSSIWLYDHAIDDMPGTSALWLGVDTNMNGQQVNCRMHITREQLKQLLPYLQTYAETGFLYDLSSLEWKQEAAQIDEMLESKEDNP